MKHSRSVDLKVDPDGVLAIRTKTVYLEVKNILSMHWLVNRREHDHRELARLEKIYRGGELKLK